MNYDDGLFCGNLFCHHVHAYGSQEKNIIRVPNQTSHQYNKYNKILQWKQQEKQC